MRESDDRMPTCGDAGGVTRSGAPCRSTLGLSSVNGRCLSHDPDRAHLALEMRRKGGVATGVARRKAKAANPKLVPDPPRTLEDAVHWSSWAMHAVAIGEIDARTGHEIGYLVNSFKAAVEKRDLLREIEELRAELAQARAAQRRPKVS